MMVNSVNTTTVEKKDRLSDHVYIFDRHTKSTKIPMIDINF